MTGLFRILAATDLSEPARHAVERGVRLASQSGASLTVMHVVSRGAMDSLRRLLGAESAPIEQHILDAARVALETLAAEPSAPGRAAVETCLATGVAAEEIAGRADELQASLLVVGARGEGFMRQALFGTTSERLVRRTRLPVLVVRRSPRQDYRRVLVAIDFSEASLAALRCAQLVAPVAEFVLLHAFELPFEGRLHLAGVTDQAVAQYRRRAQAEALARLREVAVAAGLAAGSVDLRVIHGQPTRVILEEEQARACDLVVVGKRGLGLVEELLLGSATKHVLAEGTVDVLVAGPSPWQAGIKPADGMD